MRIKFFQNLIIIAVFYDNNNNQIDFLLWLIVKLNEDSKKEPFYMNILNLLTNLYKKLVFLKLISTQT